jgi:hypothetical protein
MSKTLQGTVHGRTITLADDPGVAEGQQVEVTLRPVAPASQPGEGIRESAGALADEWTADDDRILREIAEDRRRSASRELPS